MTFRRRALALAVAGALACGLTGCVAAPEAKPSTPAPAFTSDAAAYKAAEQVYRDYVDALNQVDLADPKTFEPVFALSSGDANAADRKSFSQMHADGWTVGGDTYIKSMVPIRRSDGTVGLAVCTNIAEVTLVDPKGKSMVSPDRSDIQSKLVVVTDTPGGPRIRGFYARDGEPKCE